MNTDEFRTHGKSVIDAIADYYDSLDDLRPAPDVEPGYLFDLIPHEPPFEPESFEDIRRDMDTKITPGMTHWQSGNFFAWFSSSSSFPAMLGDMYSSMFNIIGFSWVCSPAATELETVVMDWLAKLLGLDKRYMAISQDGSESKGGGAIQTTAGEALLSLMAAGRERALDKLRIQGMAEEEVNQSRHKLVAYVSDQTHSSGEKAAIVIGCRVHKIRSDENYRMTRQALQTAIDKDRQIGLIPFFICGSFGTTNTAAIDDIPGIAGIAEDEYIWLHIDAAYAGAALACPEFRPLAHGMERADSLCFNPHKWMLTNFDCSAMWVADSTYLTRAMGIQREYLPCVKSETAAVKDYRDWQVPLGRRFRALKLWFVMRMYGVSGIRAHIRKNVAQAKWLEEQLLADGRFEIMAPVVFGLVVFRIGPSALPASVTENDHNALNKANVELVDRINREGRIFILITDLQGKCIIRAPIGAVHGSQRNIDTLLAVLQQHTTAVVCQFT